MILSEVFFFKIKFIPIPIFSTFERQNIDAYDTNGGLSGQIKNILVFVKQQLQQIIDFCVTVVTDVQQIKLASVSLVFALCVHPCERTKSSLHQLLLLFIMNSYDETYFCLFPSEDFVVFSILHVTTIMNVYFVIMTQCSIRSSYKYLIMSVLHACAQHTALLNRC